MRIGALAISILCGLAAALLGVALAAPYFTKIEWSVAGADFSFDTGFLIAGGSLTDDSWKFHLELCDSITSSSAAAICNDDLKYVMLAMSILLFISFVLFIMDAILVWLNPRGGFWVAPFAFGFAAVSFFGFVFRVLPLFRDVFQESGGSTVTVSLVYNYTGFAGFAGIIVGFIAALLMMILNKKLVKEAAEQTVLDEANKKKKEREDASKKDQAAATTANNNNTNTNSSTHRNEPTSGSPTNNNNNTGGTAAVAMGTPVRPTAYNNNNNNNMGTPSPNRPISPPSSSPPSNQNGTSNNGSRVAPPPPRR